MSSEHDLRSSVEFYNQEKYDGAFKFLGLFLQSFVVFERNIFVRAFDR